MKMHVATVHQNASFDAIFDTHPETSLDLSHVEAVLKKGYKKPFLIVDRALIRNKFRRFRAAMPRVHPHYAVKANPDPRVLTALIEEGSGFEIASIAELDLLLSLGVPVADIFIVIRSNLEPMSSMLPLKVLNGTY